MHHKNRCICPYRIGLVKHLKEEDSGMVGIHGSRGAPLNVYIPDLQIKSFFPSVLQWWQIPKNKCNQRVYLDDADDFYFWTC